MTFIVISMFIQKEFLLRNVFWGQWTDEKMTCPRKYLAKGSENYWAKINGIEIYTAVFFVKLEIEEMVKTKLKLGGPLAMYESAESGISPLIVIPRTTK